MIRTEKAHLQVVADSHEGMSGKNNEDNFAVSAYKLEGGKSSPVLLAVLSDGIGGHRAGEVASQIAVDVISQRVAASDGTNPPQTLKEAIEESSQMIYNQAQDAERKGMGATCSVAMLIENRLYTATIGDSRIYLIRGDTIQQVSIDHTWIQEALDSGLITPDQVDGHPNAHVIRRHLGGAKTSEVDLRMRLTGKETDPEAVANQGNPLHSGDILLLCSDGLTDLVEDHEIWNIVREQPNQTAVKTLIDLANERGGHDNTTIIIIEIPDTYGAPAAVKAGTGGKLPALPWLALGCFGLIIVAVVAVFMTWRLGIINRVVSKWYTPTSVPSATETFVPTPLPPTTTPSLTPVPPKPTLIPTFTPVPTFTVPPTTTTEATIDQPGDATGDSTDGDSQQGTTTEPKVSTTSTQTILPVVEMPATPTLTIFP
jgi:PPM family protein phosphatase